MLKKICDYCGNDVNENANPYVISIKSNSDEDSVCINARHQEFHGFERMDFCNVNCMVRHITGKKGYSLVDIEDESQHGVYVIDSFGVSRAKNDCDRFYLNGKLFIDIGHESPYLREQALSYLSLHRFKKGDHVSIPSIYNGVATIIEVLWNTSSNRFEYELNISNAHGRRFREEELLPI